MNRKKKHEEKYTTNMCSAHRRDWNFPMVSTISSDTETFVRIPRPLFGYRDLCLYSTNFGGLGIRTYQFGYRDLPRYPNRAMGSRYPNYFPSCLDTETPVLFGYRDPRPCSDNETPWYPNSDTETPVYLKILRLFCCIFLSSLKKKLS